MNLNRRGRQTVIAMGALIAAALIVSLAFAQGFQKELQDYILCNYKLSLVISRQSGDPMVLAMAARSNCSLEEAVVLQAMKREYKGSTFDVPDLLEDFRKRALETNVGTIVRERARRQP